MKATKFRAYRLVFELTRNRQTTDATTETASLITCLKLPLKVRERRAIANNKGGLALHIEVLHN